MVLLGITFSPAEELARWRASLGLHSTLLSDATREVAMRYGAAEDPTQAKAARLSVLIDRHGTVTQVYASPDPATHAEQVLANLNRS